MFGFAFARTKAAYQEGIKQVKKKNKKKEIQNQRETHRQKRPLKSHTDSGMQMMNGVMFI